MSKKVRCSENQAAFDHLSLVASKCLVGKRENYRFSVLKAMKSLRLYPLPIESLEEALALEGVGPTLAKEVMKAVNASKLEVLKHQQQENIAPLMKKPVLPTDRRMAEAEDEMMLGRVEKLTGRSDSEKRLSAKTTRHSSSSTEIDRFEDSNLMSDLSKDSTGSSAHSAKRRVGEMSLGSSPLDAKNRCVISRGHNSVKLRHLTHEKEATLFLEIPNSPIVEHHCDGSDSSSNVLARSFSTESEEGYRNTDGFNRGGSVEICRSEKNSSSRVGSVSMYPTGRHSAEDRTAVLRGSRMFSDRPSSTSSSLTSAKSAAPSSSSSIQYLDLTQDESSGRAIDCGSNDDNDDDGSEACRSISQPDYPTSLSIVNLDEDRNRSYANKAHVRLDTIRSAVGRGFSDGGDGNDSLHAHLVTYESVDVSSRNRERDRDRETASESWTSTQRTVTATCSRSEPRALLVTSQYAYGYGGGDCDGGRAVDQQSQSQCRSLSQSEQHCFDDNALGCDALSDGDANRDDGFRDDSEDADVCIIPQSNSASSSLRPSSSSSSASTLLLSSEVASLLQSRATALSYPTPRPTANKTEKCKKQTDCSSPAATIASLSLRAEAGAEERMLSDQCVPIVTAAAAAKSASNKATKKITKEPPRKETRRRTVVLADSSEGEGEGEGKGKGEGQREGNREGERQNCSSILAIDPCVVPLLGDVRNWEPVLIVDTREKDRHLVQNRMLEMGIACEVQVLALGDFMWVARRKASVVLAEAQRGLITNWAVSNQSQSQPCMSQRESDKADKDKEKEARAQADREAALTVALDCIAERKTSGDLASSIVDGRYNEQKQRLKACGLRSRLYIVEGQSLVVSKHASVSGSALKTAVVGTQVGYGLNVVRTRGLDHTISFLQAVHRQMCRRFYAGECGTMYLPFLEFQRRWGRKSATTVGQAFTLMLREIPGCSSAAANAMSEKYLTLARLDRTFKGLGTADAQEEISNIRKPGGAQQRIGAKLAQQIWQQLYDRF